ncbi:MAG: hypothetical protein QF489_03435 [Planctomycetota bacterium]|jgi:hypothetical protein|nr:hypothetical protein [Planctomycetota bacterium]
MFFPADFDLYEPRLQGDQEWNQRRLEVRKRLQSLGEGVVAAYAKLGIGLDRRESLHNPHATNGKRVRRQRTMVFRDKKSRKVLQNFLGKELGKDLDSARNNVHFQICIDQGGCWWGLRIDDTAWYDLNVLVKRAEESEGQKALADACQAAPGFELELNRGGARPLEKMTTRDWRDFAGVVQPGQSSMELIARMPKHAVVEAGDDFADGVIADLERLAPFYRLASWCSDSPSGVSW